jgi:DNA polymerase III alpha subunit (gram-positive type)
MQLSEIILPKGVSMALAHYFVTDIESDGPSPMDNSMLSFASVIVREDGKLVGEFETVLETRPDRNADSATMAWWKTQPDAWAAATIDAKPPKQEMCRFVNWVESFDGKRSFAARPIAFDGIWIDYYLRDYTESYLLDVSHWGKSLFTAGALDIGTYMSGIFNRTDSHTDNIIFPSTWLGEHDHTHKAIDDARGYATLLSQLLIIARKQPPHPDDFLL